MQNTHPAFTEIIKQLTPDEALLLKTIKDDTWPTVHVKASNENGSFHQVLKNYTDVAFKASCQIPSNVFSYLENLSRLGLVTINDNSAINNDSVYDELLGQPIVLRAIELAEFLGKSKIERGLFTLSPFGKQFYESCIKDNSSEQAD